MCKFCLGVSFARLPLRVLSRSFARKKDEIVPPSRNLEDIESELKKCRDMKGYRRPVKLFVARLLAWKLSSNFSRTSRTEVVGRFA